MGSITYGIDALKVWAAEPQRRYLWSVEFPPDVAPISVGGGSQSSLSLLCRRVSFGEYSFSSTRDLAWGPFQSKFPGGLSISAVSFRFLRVNPDPVSRYFTAWRRMMMSPEGLFYPKNSYASDKLYIKFLDRVSKETAVFQCLGSFPKSFPAYVLDDSTPDGDVLYVDIDVSVDKIVDQANSSTTGAW